MADKPLGCLVCLLGILCLLPPSSSLQCSDKCWFVYHPSDSRSSYQDFVVPPDKKITGIITIDKDVLWHNIGNDKDPRLNIFRLMKTDREQPLVVAIDDRPQHDTQLVIWGEIDGVINGEIKFGQQHRLTLFPDSNVSFQITDNNITSEQSYQIYVNGQHLSYNYLSVHKWERFKNTRLNTTTKIRDTDEFNVTRYNFISVCSDPKPVLCDVDSPSDSRSSTGQDFVGQVPSYKEAIITTERSQGNSTVPLRETFRFLYLENFAEFTADPLVLAIDVYYEEDQFELFAWGEATFQGLGEDTYRAQYFDRPPSKFRIFPNTTINMQLSDINITTGVRGNSEYWQYNIMWQKTSGPVLNTTAKIKDVDVTINAILAFEYTLSCSGSGAPYLSSRWDKETYGRTFEKHDEVIDTTTADNFIQSTLKIRSFTVDHIGRLTCTISNLNFQETVQKTYQFHYSEPVSLITRPSLETYDPSAGNTSLEWKVEGWPLDQIQLECDITIRSVVTYHIHRDTRQFYTRHPPRLAITLVLTSVATQDLVNCRLLDSYEPLDSTVISKVGYNCRTGQYGEGRSCLNCPRGETSFPSSTECFPVNNSCPQDQFGEDDDCTICPWGSVTFPKDMAAKEQDCIKVQSICSTGEYGYLSSGCQACPLKSTSLRGAVKFQDCTNVTNFCGKPGYWGEKNNCQPCPGNHTSDKEAVKIQDCYPVTSSCPAGYYGIDTNCTPCPDGMTSHSYTVSAKGCFEQSLSNPDEIKKEERFDFYMIAFYAIAVLALAVIASLVIYKRYGGRCATLMSYLFTTSTLSSSAEREQLRSMPELVQMHREKDTVVEVPGNPILESGSAVAEPKAEGEGDGSGIVFFK